ncbi:MAG TPA: hypothetical protein VFQ60_01820 [Patescibacteria group bacterium]|nr:hypothetical protein [Patescibacteria group bacterium]
MNEIQSTFRQQLKNAENQSTRFMQELEAKFDKLDRQEKDARALSRDTVYKIVLLSASIIGFSASLISIKGLSERINMVRLYNAWELLLGTIIVGFVLLFVEARINHAIARRYFIQDLGELGKDGYNETIRSVSWKRWVKVWCGFLLSIFTPQNLLFNKTQEDPNKKRNDAILSHLLLIRLASFGRIFVFWMENVFFALFIISLFFLIGSVQV